MMPAERLASVVRKHQAGLLLDTNVLLLFLADRTGPRFTQAWSRTAQYGERYLLPLRAAVAAAHHLVTTPHILTEATNLTTDGAARDDDRKHLKGLLREFA